jgi:hypothetical protein
MAKRKPKLKDAITARYSKKARPTPRRPVEPTPTTYFPGQPLVPPPKKKKAR